MQSKEDIKITRSVISDELHTDLITTSAVIRSAGNTTGTSGGTGTECADATEDWVYGVSRTVFPLRTGCNFSYNALKKGTGVDEAALPSKMRLKYKAITQGVVQKRKKKVKSRSSAPVAKSAA